MSHKFTLNSTFHSLLLAIDRELSELTRQGGCTCGGRLHQSNYPRSPLGLPAEFRPIYDERLSFCCDDCRKRVTPPSVRFFGRRWYPAPLLLLLSALMISINDYRLRQIKRHFGITVSESTWKRWRRWWRDAFVETHFWKQARGEISQNNHRGSSMVRRMLNVFQGLIDKKIILLLKFLSPITAGALRAV
jgi:hypothetical protein